IKFIYPSFPLASQPLFTEEIKGLIGLAMPAPDMEAKNADGPGSHSDRLYSYAHQMYKRGLVEQALSPLKKSLQMAPEYAPSHNLMGIILWKSGSFKDAVDEFDLAIKLDQNSTHAHFNYGLLLLENEEYDKAEAHIKAAISINGNLAEAHYVLGMIYKKRKQVGDALKELEEALTLFDKKKKTPAIYEPSDYNRISVLYSLSKLYAENGDYKKALDLLIKATQVSLGLEDKEETDHLHRSGDLMIYE
ncbi:MAG: tetratricopeptide repeat protein, partial [Nitrospirae bacterium]|nr:tetratricopeptide repeat protein [Nitrospirota bacterium]